jgi:hypothetical protein
MTKAPWLYPRPHHGALPLKVRRQKLALHLEVKLNSLCQLRIHPVVDSLGLPTHVHLPAVGARLATTAGFLFAAERAADLGAARAHVDICNSTIGAPGRQKGLGFSQVVCKNG